MFLTRLFSTSFSMVTLSLINKLSLAFLDRPSGQFWGCKQLAFDRVNILEMTNLNIKQTQRLSELQYSMLTLSGDSSEVLLSSRSALSAEPEVENPLRSRFFSGGEAARYATKQAMVTIAQKVTLIYKRKQSGRRT